MGLTLELNEIERLISYKPPVANLGDLYTRYPEGGQLGWFAYVSQLGAFAVWNGVSWEPNKSSDASGQYASMALAAQAAAEAALALIQTIQVDVELSAEKAEAYATTPEDVSFEGEYSALHYAAKAAAAKMSIDQIKSELQSDKQTVATDKDIVLNAKTAVKEAETNVLNNAATVGQKTVEATNAAAAASQLALGLSEAEQNAKDYRDAAYQHYLGASNKAVEASGHSESARVHKEVSISKASEASDSADAAASSAAIAGDKATLALSASTQAGLYKNAAETAQGLAEDAEAGAVSAKSYLENDLFHYISDDDISVNVGIGHNIKVSESTVGYPSVILSLQTT